jgi:hypothetical protein
LHAPSTHVTPLGQRFPQSPQWLGSVLRSTQLPDPHTSSGGQHWPRAHRSPAPHALPHAPQLRVSMSGSTQTPPHSRKPANAPHAHASPLGQPHDGLAQRHTPDTHASPGAHVTLQSPQFAESRSRSTHRPLQMAPGSGQSHGELAQPHDALLQRHALSTQVSSGEHAWPHAPQLAGSEVGSTQRPPHAIVGGLHPQRPREQGSSRAQATSHAPQCDGSELTSTHAPLQTSPRQVHAPAMHVSSLAHAMPHPPQFALDGSMHACPHARWPAAQPQRP